QGRRSPDRRVGAEGDCDRKAFGLRWQAKRDTAFAHLALNKFPRAPRIPKRRGASLPAAVQKVAPGPEAGAPLRLEDAYAIEARAVRETVRNEGGKVGTGNQRPVRRHVEGKPLD